MQGKIEIEIEKKYRSSRYPVFEAEDKGST